MGFNGMGFNGMGFKVTSNPNQSVTLSPKNTFSPPGGLEVTERAQRRTLHSGHGL